MHAPEVQALRRLLMYSAADAARRVATDADRPDGVQERTWNRWESGQQPMPDNVAARLLDLVEWRARALAQARHELAASGAAGLRVIWYSEADDWPDQPALWRPAQSVAAQLLAEHLGRLHLVQFDARAFNVWRRGDGAADSVDARARWAAQVVATPDRAPDTE